MMKPIYKPKGKAADYAPLAINIYKGCNHHCMYCYARKMAARFSPRAYTNDFDYVKQRPGIVEAVEKQLIADPNIDHADIHLCFTCDPYPAGIDTTPTREIIHLLYYHGFNRPQILTKAPSRAERDFDLLSGVGVYGCSLTWVDELEPCADPTERRIESLRRAHDQHIFTWASLEPVFHTEEVYRAIREFDFIDRFSIGKLNHMPSPIDWAAFGRECERLCKEHGRSYQIKSDLRKEMEA
jgi:DNA repair photolyase